MKEVILAQGSYGKAKELTGKIAKIKQILNLITMQKNSHPTDADMGVDIERYIHEFASDENSSIISEAIKNQLNKYLDLLVISVECTYVGEGISKTLVIKVTFKYDGVTSAVKLDFENYAYNKTINLFSN